MTQSNKLYEIYRLDAACPVKRFHWVVCDYGTDFKIAFKEGIFLISLVEQI
jgi:hypothetical protein